ncbi:MAG TPA: glycosyltransferase [Pyrinomonadaceae bacterium]|nr:glycosyltransferase [Pyrinomonadaceae bacterium]
MKVSVIIPSYNRSDALKLTLDRLSAQDFDGDWEVIVVNNNSTDDTNAVVAAQQLPCPLRLVERTTPGAVASSRNAGAREARGEYMIFIDNDILVEPCFVSSHVDLLESNPLCWVLGEILPLPEQENLPLGKFRKELQPESISNGVHETLGFTGANFSLPRTDFEKLGGFDEGFFISSSEDQEFALRARTELGVKVLSAPHIVGVHNDWAGWTFEDYCRRQGLYSHTDYYFWQRYGERHPRIQLVTESLPVDIRKDPARVLVRKVGKRLLGSQGSQIVLIRLATILERVAMARPLLWILYKLALAGAIDRGLREGRETYLLKEKDRIRVA